MTRIAKSAASIVTIAALLAAALLVRHFQSAHGLNGRAELLRLVPTDATTVVFLDFDQLRASPFLTKLYSWAPVASQDPEYVQFVQETGFNYERDLKQVLIANSTRVTSSSTLLVADGRFDRAKIEAFLIRTGNAGQQPHQKVFVVPAGSPDKHDRLVALTFLSNHRVAITNAENPDAVLSSIPSQPGLSDWQTHFDRLAGAPMFAVIRQDPALQAALTSVAPGGFRSPQLAVILNQLRWISIAGRPDADLLRVVAEGECPSDPIATQLRDFLQGIQLLAQDGLNDPKLRQTMNPEERKAYLELLSTADIAKIDRGDSKSVRLVITVTPQFLELAKSLRVPVPGVAGPPGPTAAKSSAQAKSRTAKER